MGLSQEGLGERLGVSRQAIYKWESDTSLPEIDKLITLSKIFSLPVGWLLGVEQAGRQMVYYQDSFRYDRSANPMMSTTSGQAFPFDGYSVYPGSPNHWTF